MPSGLSDIMQNGDITPPDFEDLHHSPGLLHILPPMPPGPTLTCYYHKTGVGNLSDPLGCMPFSPPSPLLEAGYNPNKLENGLESSGGLPPLPPSPCLGSSEPELLDSMLDSLPTLPPNRLSTPLPPTETPSVHNSAKRPKRTLVSIIRHRKKVTWGPITYEATFDPEEPPNQEMRIAKRGSSALGELYGVHAKPENPPKKKENWPHHHRVIYGLKNLNDYSDEATENEEPGCRYLRATFEMKRTSFPRDVEQDHTMAVVYFGREFGYDDESKDIPHELTTFFKYYNSEFWSEGSVEEAYDSHELQEESDDSHELQEESDDSHEHARASDSDDSENETAVYGYRLPEMTASYLEEGPYFDEIVDQEAEAFAAYRVYQEHEAYRESTEHGGRRTYQEEVGSGPEAEDGWTRVRTGEEDTEYENRRTSDSPANDPSAGYLEKTSGTSSTLDKAHTAPSLEAEGETTSVAVEVVSEAQDPKKRADEDTPKGNTMQTQIEGSSKSSPTSSFCFGRAEPRSRSKQRSPPNASNKAKKPSWMQRWLNDLKKTKANDLETTNEEQKGDSEKGRDG